MAEYSFRNLVLWQKAQALTLEVARVVERLPRSGLAGVIGPQILASASSIGANVAEGHGRFTPGAHKNHLSIAKGSACETDGWIDLLLRAGLLAKDEEGKLHEACSELIRMLTAKILDLERLEGLNRRKVLREEQEVYSAEDYVNSE